MNSRFLARRRAEDFADSLAALDRGEAGDERADAPLLELVGALRSMEAPAPRAAFVDDLRERLMAEAETTLTPQAARLSLPPRTRGARERRFVAAASVAVLLGGSATMATAAQDALPGEALYPIKRGIEQARSSLTFSEDGKGHQLLDRATGRLAEAARLAADGDAVGLEERIRATLDDFLGHTNEGTALLFASYRESGDVADVETVRAFLATSLRSLDALTDQVPAALHGDLADLAVRVRDLDAEAATLCGECGPGEALELPTTFLALDEVKQALQATGDADGELTNAHPVRPEVEIEIPTLPSAPASPTRPARPGDEGGQQAEPPAAGGDAPAAPQPGTTDEVPKGLLGTVVDLLNPRGQNTGTKPAAPKGDGGSTKAPEGDKGGASPSPTPTEKPLQELGESLGDLLGTLLGGK